MREVTLSEMLSCREERVELQKEMLKKYTCPLICFTMNIAGPIKTSPLIERGFNEGLLCLFNAISEKKIIQKTVRFKKTGPEAFIAVNMPANEIKEICVCIEEGSLLGRLFDMDVLSPDGEKLVRKNERGCIVCGKAGRSCAASRAHSVDEIAEVTNNILKEYFLEKDAKEISELAKQSLVDEVNTTPKAGLVDRNNCGSHSDMSIDTFIKSAQALKPYFKECFLIGAKTQNEKYNTVFSLLKKEGIEAEKTMLKASGGVNTHKGAIYSLGAVCGALGRLYSAENPIADTAEILDEAVLILKAAAQKDLDTCSGKTAGERLYLEQGIKGIRGQAMSGFPDVRNISLPAFTKEIWCGKSKNDAAAIALVCLIASVEDTNLYKRGGKQGAEFAKNYACSLLEKDITHSELLKMDEEFIKRNLSPGGCADLLALTLFLHSIKNKKLP